MDEQEQIWQKRFRELARRAATRQRPEYTDFLTPAEQELLTRTGFAAADAPYLLWGGWEAAERKLACFAPEPTPAQSRRRCNAWRSRRRRRNLPALWATATFWAR